MSKLNNHAAVLLLGLSIVAGCQPLPHPFDDSQLPPDAPILAVPEAYGVIVGPIMNLADPQAMILRMAMVRGLQDADVPAALSVGNGHSFYLSGTAIVAASDGSVTVKWHLSDWRHATLGIDAQRILLPTLSGKAADRVLDPPFHAEALKLAALIIPPAPIEEKPSREIYVAPVKGAPGDGRTSLAASMAFLIDRAGLSVTEKPGGKDTVTIQGFVTLKPAPKNQQDVRIDWHVIRPNGSEVGMVSQQNTVAIGSLNGIWSDIAMAVASSARDDVLALAARVPEKGRDGG